MMIDIITNSCFRQSDGHLGEAGPGDDSHACRHDLREDTLKATTGRVALLLDPQ